VHWTPKRVTFADYEKSFISSVDCGSNHTGFIDDIGRLFMCGKGDQG